MIRRLTPLVLPVAFALAQEEELEPLEIEGHSSPHHQEAKAFDQSQLGNTPSVHLDRLLQENPSFGAYRRSDSGIAHPTSQGVSLRGTGTSAASRSLILLDGVPLNDSFGGWIRWNRFSLGELESVRFGGASSFVSSAGTILVQSRRPDKRPIHELRLATGDVHGFSADLFAATAAKKEDWDATASFRVEDFSGHPVVRASQRGPVDEDAWSRMRAARASISRQLSMGRLTARVAGFDEWRGNGTPLGRNQGDGLDWSLQLNGETTDTILFGQERDFSSVFPKVAADRASESVALDQYAVPAKSLGLVHQRRWEEGDHEYSFALSAIRREGHTHEENKFTNTIRRAGGRQTQVGASFTSTWNPAENWVLATRLRTDWFRDDQGMRSGWTATDETFPAREKVAAGGSLELGRKLSEALGARAILRSHARQPTLN
ncbi:MAG: TonB-dependent receptor plug domain-containing protein, partial [Opitutales bacterium]